MSDNHQHQYIPPLTKNNNAIPHMHTLKVMVVTYNTSVSFKQHIYVNKVTTV